MSARIEEIRTENRHGDVSARDIEWLCKVADAAEALICVGALHEIARREREVRRLLLEEVQRCPVPLCEHGPRVDGLAFNLAMQERERRRRLDDLGIDSGMATAALIENVAEKLLEEHSETLEKLAADESS